MRFLIKKIYFGVKCNTYKKTDYIEVCLTYEVLENIGTNEKIEF